jgi:hypothetical protein
VTSSPLQGGLVVRATLSFAVMDAREPVQPATAP